MSTPAPIPKGDLEARLSRLLAASVLLATAVGLAGLVLYLIEHRGVRADLSTFAPEPERLRQPGQIVSHAFALDSSAVLQFAVLLLIFTPIVRVLFSLVMFAAKRDWLYVMITALVLAALGVGLAVK
jgi:uncharacterized membrane protein